MKTKKLSGVLSLVLTMAMFLTILSPISTHALTDKRSDEFDLINRAYEILEMTDTSYNSRMITPVIEVLTDTETIQEIKITEGNKTNILLYDLTTEDLYVNGNIVIDELINISEGNDHTRALGSATDREQRSLNVGAAIGSLTKSALTLILAAKFPEFTNSKLATVAEAILDAAEALIDLALSYYIYYETWVQLDSSYTWYRKHLQVYKDRYITPCIYTYHDIQGAN